MGRRFERGHDCRVPRAPRNKWWGALPAPAAVAIGDVKDFTTALCSSTVAPGYTNPDNAVDIGIPLAFLVTEIGSCDWTTVE